MANVLVNENSLKAIGNAIREKNGEETLYKPAEMAPAIQAISTGAALETDWYMVTPSAITGYLDLSPYADEKDDIVAIIWTPGQSIKPSSTSLTGEAYLLSYFANNEHPGTDTQKYKLQAYTTGKRTTSPYESYINTAGELSTYGLLFYKNPFRIALGSANDTSYTTKGFSTRPMIVVTKKKKEA